jgi:single-strand DNA-binding protein
MLMQNVIFVVHFKIKKEQKMAKSMNRVTLCGNLGSDPEISTLPSGVMLAKASLATTESYKDKNTGEWKENIEWHRLVMWDNLAKIAGEYLRKGNKILIEGRIKYGQYMAQDGQTRYTTDIVVNDLIMMNKSDSVGGDNFQQNQINEQSESTYSNASAIVEKLASHLTPDVENDDIPF